MNVRAILLSTMVMTMGMGTCWASPLLPGLCKSLITGIFSAEIPLQKELHLHIQSAGVADAKIDLKDARLHDMDVSVSECSVIKDDASGLQDVVFDLTFKTAQMTSPNVTLSGTLVDHIQLRGSGKGNILCKDLQVKLTGKASKFHLPLEMHFEEIHLDLNLFQWTVELEGMMSGTDLNAVLNEFLSMTGPEIFEVIEKNLNSDNTLLNIINCIIPDGGDNCGHMFALNQEADE
ncbi:uncharacterized protein LOC143041486 [Oratosquilla oratoria]|uniref:uncharacterized protein LOC143041486 n=1 Tax=Oratosquilla oratoria TaxID=337810 RepID=UPI003F771A26